jgi:MORN repeat variant
MHKFYLKLLVICLIISSCVEDEVGKYIVAYRYPNGNKKSEIKYVLGSDKKCLREYYPSGSLEVEYCVIDEAIEGEYKKFHENGRIACEAFYKDGQMEGVVRFYYPSGNLEQMKYYVNGKREGMMQIFRYNGKLIAENFVVADTIHYAKYYNYDSLNNFTGTSENYTPDVWLSADRVKYKDTFEIVFNLPLPLDKFKTDSMVVKYDWKKLEGFETTTKEFAYPTHSKILIGGKAKKRFTAEEKGNYLLYGFLTKEVNGEEVEYRQFERPFSIE